MPISLPVGASGAREPERAARRIPSKVRACVIDMISEGIGFIEAAQRHACDRQPCGSGCIGPSVPRLSEASARLIAWRSHAELSALWPMLGIIRSIARPELTRRERLLRSIITKTRTRMRVNGLRLGYQ